MRISDWSSDVCSSDLFGRRHRHIGDRRTEQPPHRAKLQLVAKRGGGAVRVDIIDVLGLEARLLERHLHRAETARTFRMRRGDVRSEEHTSELQSLMRISYAVFCLKKKKTTRTDTIQTLKEEQQEIQSA